MSRLVVIRNPCLWPVVFLGLGSVQGDHALGGVVREERLTPRARGGASRSRPGQLTPACAGRTSPPAG